MGRSGGTELAPAALRERDLPSRLGAEDRGDLDVRIRGDRRDPATGVIGIDGVVLGARDPEEARDIAALRASELAAVEVRPDALRAQGLANAADRAGQRLGRRFFVHLDVDVLDERAMPATDYLMRGGLQWDELAELLEPLGRSAARRRWPGSASDA